MDLISPAEETIPIFTASGRMSVNTLVDLLFQEFRCYLENPLTPVVFWAVSAVIALIPYTLRFAIIVFKSAWMPAPPLESLPAIVNACLHHKNSFQASITFIRRRKVVPQCAAAEMFSA